MKRLLEFLSIRSLKYRLSTSVRSKTLVKMCVAYLQSLYLYRISWKAFSPHNGLRWVGGWQISVLLVPDEPGSISLTSEEWKTWLAWMENANQKPGIEWAWQQVLPPTAFQPAQLVTVCRVLSSRRLCNLREATHFLFKRYDTSRQTLKSSSWKRIPFSTSWELIHYFSWIWNHSSVYLEYGKNTLWKCRRHHHGHHVE